MSDNDRSKPDSDLEREIRQGRKFDPKEALARMAGPGAMKGASPVSVVQQAEIEIGTWLRSNLTDPAGALAVVLHRSLKGSEPLLGNIDQPLLALLGYCQDLLASDFQLTELVREADVEWGRKMDELPRFDREGTASDPADAYTAASVRKALAEVVRQLAATG